jgi:hypothetical protein
VFKGARVTPFCPVNSSRKPTARGDKIVLLNASRRVQKGRPKSFITGTIFASAAFLKGPIEGEVAVITRGRGQMSKKSVTRLIGAFFKHADKDIDAHTNIDPEDLRQWNEIFLLTFIRGHSDLFSNLSWRMRAYYKWMAVQAIGTDLDTLPHAKIIRESDRLSRPQNTN